jgi:hypothetical protein
VYALQRLLTDLMESDFYQECAESHDRHLAYRFFRVRQLRGLAALDMQILRAKHEHELEEVRGLSTDSVDDMITSLHQNTGVLSKIETKTTQSFLDSSRRRQLGQRIWYQIVLPLAEHVISVMAHAACVNSEAGMNMLTLESLRQVMFVQLDTIAQGDEYFPDPTEQEFLNSLPPSIPLHFQSLWESVKGEVTGSADRLTLVICYLCLYFRRIAPLACIVLCFIYIVCRPYFLGLIVLIIFLGILVPLDLRGVTVFLQIFLVLSMFVAFLKYIVAIPFIKEAILNSLGSAALQRSNVNYWAFFGLDPTENSYLELTLLVFAVFYIVDQMSQCEVHSPDYYVQFFRARLPGFPYEQCKGIMEDPLSDLHLTMDVVPNLKEQLHGIFHHIGAIGTTHSGWILLIDMISFIVLAACWGNWVSDPAVTEGGNSDTVFSINAGFVFVLLIHIIFTLLVYWTDIASRFILLYIVSVIWLFYTYVLIFFIVSSITRDIDASASLFFFLRFASMVLVAGKCFVGREILAFKYPNFATERRKILASGRFIRMVPYVFEIHTLLLWMSKKTLVPLIDFFIVRDMNLQLEILIARQMDPTYGEPPKPLHLRVWGIILLILFGALWFGPMFLISNGTASTEINPPRYCLLEVGVGSLPPLYKATGTMGEVTEDEHQQMADSKISSLSFMVWNDRSLISRVDFPAFLFQVWKAQGSLLTNLSSLLDQPNIPASMYYIFTLYFDYATTSTPTTSFSWHQYGPALSRDAIELLIAWLTPNTSISDVHSLPGISMPPLKKP